ncbi:hypothetical protein ANANG_G00218680 [Anguilla anguilla]|uniref:EGF-like domain-containing protein n=1 Tax=Anguilla anguilla TaxID=7936 RepID=A0A9D3RPI5_ANGAN|nr:hypothetical protein ANANG_G00218680 [Anguilla anguilla]
METRLTVSPTAPTPSAPANQASRRQAKTAAKIRMSASVSACAPTSATTRRAPTSAAATSTSPKSTTPARPTVRTVTGRCSTSPTTTRSGAWTPVCPTGCTGRPSRGTPTCASTPWTCTSSPTRSSGPTGTRAASPSTSCPPPRQTPTATATAGRPRPASQTWRSRALRCLAGSVDWVAGNIYWTDSGRDVIEVAQMSGQNRKTLISGMIDEPHAIVVDPQRGTMYWADWGNHPKIETAAMDGTMRETLVQGNIQWPTGLAVDYFNERLYWADAKLSVIGSVRLNGTDPVVAVSGIKNQLHHPFSIDIFEDYIYGVTYVDNIVFRVNKFGKGPVEKMTTGINHATDVVLYHRYKQPEMTNPCDRKKCEWLCLLSPSGPVCTCPNGRVLDNGTCVDPCDRKSPLSPPSRTCSMLCLNGGSCFLNSRKQPKCRCQPNYSGRGPNYCQNGGICTASHRTSTPTCRCLTGFTGPKCNLLTCRDYCLNEGNCTVTRGNQPACSCPADYLGDKCQYSKCHGFCQNGGTCLQLSDGTMHCRCPLQFEGSACEVDKCHYCKDGKCIHGNSYSLTGEVTCNCTNGSIQPSCYTCEDYCIHGLCSINTHTTLPECSCLTGWSGNRCQLVAAPVDSSVSNDKTTSIVIPVLLLLLVVLLVGGAIFWYKRRMRGAKGFQHQRMTNGDMNVEIGNPAYKIYEGEPDEDVGELLDSDFTLDPDKPTNFTNPVYATLYMGAHNSRNSLASTDEKRELLSQGEEDVVDPLA